MIKKNVVADEVYFFFRFLKRSIPIGLGVSILIFFIAYGGIHIINPDYSQIRYEPAKNSDMFSVEPSGIFLGSPYEFNEKVFYYSRPIIMNGGWTSTEDLKQDFKFQLHKYTRMAVKNSFLFGLLVMFGIPILVILVRTIRRVIKNNIAWVNNNKTK